MFRKGTHDFTNVQHGLDTAPHFCRSRRSGIDVMMLRKSNHTLPIFYDTFESNHISFTVDGDKIKSHTFIVSITI